MRSFTLLLATLFITPMAFCAADELSNLKNYTYGDIDPSVRLGNVLDNRTDCPSPYWERREDKQGRVQVIYLCDFASSQRYINEQLRSLINFETNRKAEKVKSSNVNLNALNEVDTFRRSSVYKAISEVDKGIKTIFSTLNGGIGNEGDVFDYARRLTTFTREISSNNIDTLTNESNNLYEAANELNSFDGTYGATLQASLQIKNNVAIIKNLLATDPYTQGIDKHIPYLISKAAKSKDDIASEVSTQEESIKNTESIDNLINKYQALSNSVLEQVIIWNFTTEGEPYISGMGYTLMNANQVITQIQSIPTEYAYQLKDIYSDKKRIEDSTILSNVVSKLIDNATAPGFQSEQHNPAGSSKPATKTYKLYCGPQSDTCSYTTEEGKDLTLTRDQLPKYVPMYSGKTGNPANNDISNSDGGDCQFESCTDAQNKVIGLNPDYYSDR